MKKILALFPNIFLEQPCLLWNIKFDNLQLISNDTLKPSALAIWGYKDNDKKKAALRELKILHCHLILAAYLMDRDPLTICKMYILKEVTNGKCCKGEVQVSLKLLAKYLPNQLEESGQTVCWFAQYLEQDKQDERNRVFRLYNALGTLPGGFNNIRNLPINDDEYKITDKLLKRIEDFHAVDNEEEYREGYVYETKPFSMDEIKVLEAYYLQCLIRHFPEFKKEN